MSSRRELGPGTVSALSTVILKKPNSAEALRVEKRDRPIYTAGFVSVCLWALAAIVNATCVDISPNVNGVSLSLTTQDVLVMLMSTWMLTKGLYKSSQCLVLPWLVISSWNLYNSHYRSIIRMASILQHTRLQTKIPWIALGFDMFGLGMPKSKYKKGVPYLVTR